MSAVTAPLKRRPDPSPRRARHLEVVEPPVRRHTLPYALLIIAVLASAVFGVVTLNALAAAASVDARELDARVTEAERAYAQLVADVAALESPERIRTAALELGMEPAGPGRHLVLERNLPADGATTIADDLATSPDPLKSILSAQH